MPSFTSKPRKISNLEIHQFSPPASKIKMLKMKVEPTMLMKTQGRTTKCRLKSIQFHAVIGRFPHQFHPNPYGISEHSIRTPQALILETCRLQRRKRSGLNLPVLTGQWATTYPAGKRALQIPTSVPRISDQHATPEKAASPVILEDYDHAKG